MKVTKKRTWHGLMLSLLLLAFPGYAHTESETNAVAKSMLEFVLLSANDNLDDVDDGVEHEAIVTWPSFLALGESEGWTPSEKKAAFAWYLSALGTKDCTSLSVKDQELVRIALSKCDVLNYIEAVPSYKALALNPKGIYRHRAIELVIKYCPVDSTTTGFIVTIMTNSTVYSLMECGVASCLYANKLLSFNATNEIQMAFRDNAVRMFYQNRMEESVATEIVDDLFLKYISGYVTSSNRLAFAINAIASPSCVPSDSRYFTAVTNQLLSSGQPLPWINFGGGGN